MGNNETNGWRPLNGIRDLSITCTDADLGDRFFQKKGGVESELSRYRRVFLSAQMAVLVSVLL